MDALEEKEERRAVLALWAVPGVGPKGLAQLKLRLGAGLAPLLRAPVREWVQESGFSQPVQQKLSLLEALEPLASRVEERLDAGEMAAVFPGDEGFPERLVGLRDAPPVLFCRGTVRRPFRRVAMVGSRRPESGFLTWARTFAKEVAAGGVSIISGAAEGVDRAAHEGCMDAGQETWAFVGSALDALDPPQARLLPRVLDKGGRFYSELPPGVRASTTTFPRRNRLISGASDAVLVMRAARKSGALHTALYALEQGRALLAVPGDLFNPLAEGCNSLIWTRHAQLCRGPADIWRALGLRPEVEAVPVERDGVQPSEAVSKEAREAYQLLTREPRSFDELLGQGKFSSATLTSALCELELTGLALQSPGKRYERI